MLKGSTIFPHCRTKEFLQPSIKKLELFHHFTWTGQPQRHENLVRPHQQISHTPRPPLWTLRRSVGYYSVTGWLETNLDHGDCDHSCTVIRTQSHDLWSYRDRKRSTPFRTSGGGNCNRQGLSKLQVEVNVSMTVLYRQTKKSWCPSQILIWTKLWGYSWFWIRTVCCDSPVRSGIYQSKFVKCKIMFHHHVW